MPAGKGLFGRDICAVVAARIPTLRLIFNYRLAIERSSQQSETAIQLTASKNQIDTTNAQIFFSRNSRVEQIEPTHTYAKSEKGFMKLTSADSFLLSAD